MPSYIFSNQISLSGNTNPVNLAYSTSFSAVSSPLGQAIGWVGVTGTAASILFNLPSIPFTTQSAQIVANGQTLVVNAAFNGTVMSVVSTDGTTTAFVCLTATSAQSLSSNGYDSVSPDSLRMRNLGYN